ncbi:chromosomal replication initiator protein DnaA [Dyadobacter psychrotolerans]|uniref:Chromosomal replication initiator protein DnaA n=1 Tax=Dyadobacter psychrotolerans TaxID=2541721 RepID=A0A4R5DEY7_9BACT|nr:chromosomal replication initiator protein DnaA [Dyadobacter psychrotolerans]TDE10324.1 chromosomal replication initiator protein DnaA [Dyadobacter psychrotolerans]
MERVSAHKEVDQIWNACLSVIQQHIPDQSFRTWFEPIRPLKLYGKVLTIQVPSQFFYEWLEDNYVNLLRKALDYAIGRDGLLEYSIIVDKGNEKHQPLTMNVSTPKSPNYSKPDNFATDPRMGSIIKLKDHDSMNLDTYLNPNYSFDNFIEGDCNRLARSAGFAVAQRPGLTSFNPLMMYGGVGLGKTHLVQAIGNYIMNHFDNKLVLYVSSEKFTNQFINSIKNNTLQDFTDFYMKVDVLAIDDVQFLSGKEKTQDTFFHIFNHLHQLGKQIIMTSDRPPRELVGLQDRLLSRFKWGLTADLQTPDFETRIAIIQKKIQSEGISIDYDVIEYVAHSVNSNVRELEGVIVSLMAQASLTRREIDVELAKNTLRNIVMNEDKEVTIDTIQEVIADYFQVTIADLKSKSRKKEVVYPRQLAMFLAKEYTELPLKSIGYHFGGRDHSTVIHSIQSINLLMDETPDVEETLQKLRSYFK